MAGRYVAAKEGLLLNAITLILLFAKKYSSRKSISQNDRRVNQYPKDPLAESAPGSRPPRSSTPFSPAARWIQRQDIGFSANFTLQAVGFVVWFRQSLNTNVHLKGADRRATSRKNNVAGNTWPSAALQRSGALLTRLQQTHLLLYFPPPSSAGRGDTGHWQSATTPSPSRAATSCNLYPMAATQATPIQYSLFTP